MADLLGADAYFAQTTRKDVWAGHPEERRAAAVSEAIMMIGRLSYARQPPTSNADNATYEQAYCLLESDDKFVRDTAAARAVGIRIQSIADASEHYFSAAELEKAPGWIHGVYYCPRALAWLDGYYLRSGRARMGKLVGQ